MPNTFKSTWTRKESNLSPPTSKKSRSAVSRQNDAQQFLGQVRATRQQESSRRHLGTSPTPRTLERRHAHRADSSRHERRNGRSRLQTSRRRRVRSSQHQHLRGLFHHLLGTTQTLPRRTKSSTPRTGPLLRHRLHHLLPSSRRTPPSHGRSSRRIHQRTQTR